MIYIRKVKQKYNLLTKRSAEWWILRIYTRYNVYNQILRLYDIMCCFKYNDVEV